MCHPLELKDALLTKDGEVISSLFTSGDHKNFFISVVPQHPQHEGGSDPALA
jgi:hypothetical protein